MSSSATRSASQSPTKQAEFLQPIPTNATPQSQALRHGIPAAILSTFVFLFPKLVRSPIPKMRLLLYITTAYQLLSTLVILPPAGSQAAKTRKLRPGEKKKDAPGPNIAVTTLLSAFLTTFTIPLLHIAIVLLGAPFLTHAPHTLLLAAHLAVLALFPLFYIHGVDSASWLALAGFRAPVDESYGGAIGAVVGAWLGAVPIPLDWDREWQAWPLTVLCGMYGGYVVGRILGGTVFYGRRFGS